MILEYKEKLSLENISKFTKNILEKIKPLNLSKDAIFDLRLCIEEALINAVKHGNKMNKNKSISMKVVFDKNSLCFEIKDEGEGFDQNEVGVPTEGDNIHKLSERGVFLIKKFMDEVEYLDGGNRIRMVKYTDKKE